MRKLVFFLLSMLMINSQLLAQNRSVSGRITDEAGAAVPAATVMVKGTSVGTTTDNEGRFSISVPPNGRTLVISGVGFTTQEVAIGTAPTIAITLRAGAASMEEVVVTGYSRERRRTFTGAATTLGSKTVETVPVGSFNQALQGRVPGLLANSGSGQPGANANVRIRGTSSIGGQAQPLYIVDGVPLSTADISIINPNDFESITVLKDATASALYGARGGLGVIVITTKRGKAGQANFTARTQYGFTRRPQPSQFDQMNSTEMLAYEEFVGGFAPALTAPGWVWSPKHPNYNVLQSGFTSLAQQHARYAFLLDSFRNNNVDYYDVLFRTGITQTHEINMSGGNANTRYFMSLGNFNQQGTDRKSRLNRYTVRFNLDNTVGKLTTQFNSTVAYAKTDYNEGTFYAANGAANPFAMVWRSKPYENPYRADGSVIFGPSTPTNPRAVGNLIERSDNSNWVENTIKVNAGLNLALKILPTLTLRNVVGIDAANDMAQGNIYAGTYVGSLQSFQNGYLNEATNGRMQLINTTSLVYSNRFGTMHDVEVGGYFEGIRQYNKANNFTMFNLDPRLRQTGQGAGALTTGGAASIGQNANSAKSGFGIRSFFGNGRYTYNNKYTVSGSLRRDGTSRIVKEENKEITTWAAGFTWDAIKESFISNQKVLSDLRFRATYGSVPNIGSIPGGSFGIGGVWYSVANYHAAQLPAFGTTNYAGAPSVIGLAPTVANPDLRIETVEKTNIGVDLGFVDNRIRLSVDAYRNVTKDLFVSQRLPATSGFYGSSLSINAGTMSNKGLEFDLTVDVVRTRDFEVTLSANHAINKNRIEDLGSVTEYPAGTGIIKKGLPIGTHLSFTYLGADPATGRPIYKRADGSPTTNINEAGQFHDFGSWLPVHTGGFSSLIRWKGLTVDAFFSYQMDVRRYNNTQNWVTQGDAVYTGAVTQSRVLLTDQWQKPGDVKMLQSPAFSRQFTSYDISDAKFLRFRNLNISYNIPPVSIGATRLIKSARVYVQGQNLAIWSPWSGLDPEDDNNISLGEFPNPRAFVFGIDINF
jgi:TonB-linked SusC/RagA family outer membrane protein